MAFEFKLAEYYLFVRWIATPQPFRKPKTQEQFQIKFGVSHDTVSRFKKDPNYKDDIRRAVNEWASEELPNVIGALYLKIIRTGNAQEVGLWLEYIDKWVKTQEQRNVVEVGQNLADLIEKKWQERQKLKHADNLNDGTRTL